MSFDKPTRNHLAKVIDACRERLAEDVTAQLQSVYGLYSDGTRLDVAQTADERHAAAELRALLDHFESVATESKTRSVDAYQRLVREIGFTGLNRLAALRLGEERGLLIECVRRGMDSDGFRLYDRLANGSLGNRYQTYRAFLEGLYDEMALDLGALFDRHTPHSQVFPSEATLNDVLVLLNDPALTARDIWQHDETIGWIYQYYNDPTERKKMRDASQAPRNSRELAVRNQFFTPRYVVEFLTDNTLARIWYEMRQGQTRLTEQCRYLVRRANEIWLKKGEQPPPTENAATDQSQEELLKKSAYIPFREKKDPRSLKLLDPACGSGHFLLYAFDLFETIYAEAYDDPDLEPDLRASYPDRAEYMRQVPRLILEDNLFGIDIDPRAAQIAALALWLRAQRAYQAMRLAPAERPRITRVNIIIAEPMPGDGVLLDEFIRNLPNTLTPEQHPEIIGPLVRIVFEKMKLAGEAGSLLKIEEEMRDAIESGRKSWASRSVAKQLDLLPETKKPQQLALDVSNVSDETFWRQAEELTLKALSEYAHQAENGQGMRRRLFAEDAEQGFAFIDVCRKIYDVVLMNPPYGLPSLMTKDYLSDRYSSIWIEIYAMFLQRGYDRLQINGFLAAFTSRTWLNLSKLEPLRKKILDEVNINLLIDAGAGELDGAAVETSAFVTLNAPPDQYHEGIFFDLSKSSDKNGDLISGITSLYENIILNFTYRKRQSFFAQLPGNIIGFQIPGSMEKLFISETNKQGLFTAKPGIATGDDFRFIRVRWEVDYYLIGRRKWLSCVMGGQAEEFYRDLITLVNWSDDGSEIKAENDKNYGSYSRMLRNLDLLGRPGLTYIYTGSTFSVQVLPEETVITMAGQGLYPSSPSDAYPILGILNTNLVRILLKVINPGRFFQSNYVNKLPRPRNFDLITGELSQVTKESFKIKRQLAQTEETSPIFSSSRMGFISSGDFTTRLKNELKNQISHLNKLALVAWQINESEYELLVEMTGITPSKNKSAEEEIKDESNHFEQVVSFLVGSVFGRWDFRLTLDITLEPNLSSNIYATLPICPPGMLVGPDGLPAIAGRIVSEDWLRARPDAITLPAITDHGTVINAQGQEKPAITPDENYPLAIAWDGILVDDPGLGKHPELHPSDIVRRIEAAMTILWPENYESVIAEACETLGVKDLREYFSRPAGFFADHLKRYSKSRRQAPIYWPLSTASGGYTLWFYYPRLSQEMLYTAVNRYLTPKIGQVEGYIYNLERDLANTFGGAASRLRDQITEMGSFLAELNALRTDLLRVADLPYQPDLNDGVIINAAPLYKLFRLSKWAKDCQATWEKLQAGEYDWAHMAFVLWPERVRMKCKNDKSLAIAHGLESLWQGEKQKTKAKRLPRSADLEQGDLGLEID